MHITSHFDGGNITVEGYPADNIAHVKIERDAKADFRQWFAFRCVVATNTPQTIVVTNAGQCNRKEGWRGFRAVASYDRVRWFRVPTSFDEKQARIEFTPEFPVFYLAAFALYPLERHAEMLARWQTRPGVSISVIGESVEGRPIDLVTIGNEPRTKLHCWVVARQHPSETMAQWCAEGLVEHLLDDQDETVRQLKEKAVFFVVPNANPDGSFRGHTRTNAAGIDLNRAWQDCNEKTSPEVLAIRRHMQRTGVDFFLDIHGEESIPYCFIAPSEGVPSLTPERIRLRQRYQQALLEADPHFQTEHGYPPDPQKGNDLKIGADYVGETFRCLSLTLEQPFKDIAGKPVDYEGWSPRLSRQLGAANLSALAAVVDELR